MPLRTRLTERLGIQHPVLSAPMAFAAGGKLAAAVTSAGGLGLIGGGYGDAGWLDEQFRAAGNARVGCGFITWSLARQPELLDQVLAHKPKAVFLSFGDPRPFGAKVTASGAMLICQVQTIADAREALEAGADIIVAQGAEAGGHAEKRGLMPLAPEVADLLAARSPGTLLCAAGGIADGRGLAAALMLGADGVVVGSRFTMAEEALVFPGWQEAVKRASGDDTVPTRVVDIARKRDWPRRFKIRVLENALTRRWQGREEQLRAGQAEAARDYDKAAAAGDTDNYGVIIGEAAGLLHGVAPAGEIVHEMVADAESRLKAARALIA